MRQSRSRQSQSHSPPPGQTSALLGRSHTFVPPDMTTWSPAMIPLWHSWTHTHITQHQEEEGMAGTSVVQLTVYSQVCLPSGSCNPSFRTAFECSNWGTLFKHLMHHHTQHWSFNFERVAFLFSLFGSLENILMYKYTLNSGLQRHFTIRLTHEWKKSILKGSKWCTAASITIWHCEASWERKA